MIQESGSIPTSKDRGAPRNCTKYKIFIGRRGKGKGESRLPHHPLRVERAYVADYFTGADQKIPDQLVKTTFLGEVITTI